MLPIRHEEYANRPRKSTQCTWACSFAEVCKRYWAVHGLPVGCSSSASVLAGEVSINRLLSIANHDYVYCSCNKLSRSCTVTCSSSHERCQMPWKPLGGVQIIFMNSVGMLCGQASGLQTDYAWILERHPRKRRWTRNPVYCIILSKANDDGCAC
jgi:hypothetical protein